MNCELLGPVLFVGSVACIALAVIVWPRARAFKEPE